MAQITHGVRSILSSAVVYDLTQRILGAERSRRILVRDYIRPEHGDLVFDIGCGTAEMLRHLPGHVRYIGFDLSQSYIDAARSRFGDRGSFECIDVADYQDSAHDGGADIALAIGLLHHLDDDRAAALMRTAWNKLRPGGRLITIDGTLVPDQSGMARAIILKDRGQNIREPAQYTSLATQVFDSVKTTVRHDMLFVPYTHCILECTR
ncbi:SAM-dependent methyltransferase [Lysobacter soli]|uniref:SAM-dependent methyltransferase n=1 Tax=Lysobacter soli TaxID=453783 RepID=UPI00240F03C7|nr:class I SAM-dependent methyltransferase [Lysobacter soli]MDG2516971.1 class I SAM-dependent methyltransferase [Lysobacter soli]